MYEDRKTGTLRVAMKVLTVLCMFVFVARPVSAQEKPECKEGFVAVGDLGISQIEGTIQIGKPDGKGDVIMLLRFMSEPVVREIDPEGPAAGKLVRGDVIVAVDGKLITAEDAGMAFVDPPVGVPVELRIRRDDREAIVRVSPEWLCVDKDSAHFPHWVNVYRRVMIRLPRPAREIEERIDDRIRKSTGLPEGESEYYRPEREAPPRPPKTPSPEFKAAARPPRPDRPEAPRPGLPHPWMGFGLECSIDGNWVDDDMRFTEPPRVFRVEPESKAEEAGLRRRDVLTHIDGIPIDTVEGTEHFMKIKPGQRIEWKVLREGKPVEIAMEAQPIPEWEERLQRDEQTGIVRNPLVDAIRYTGALGNTAVEVRGSVPVNVTVDDATGQIVIQTPDTTIRLKKTN